MADLRAPDPTLDALDARVILRRTDAGAQLIAHHERYEPGEIVPFTACGLGRAGSLPRLMARDVAYTAVPCRTCFPDAPEPGYRPVGNDPNGGPVGWRADPHLAWQADDDPCVHDSVDTFASGAGRRVDVCMGCHLALRFWNADQEPADV